MKKTIEDYDLKDKKVIIRVDFNVPLKDGIITDDNRIRAALPTIQYAINNKAKVILLSHLGRIKCEEDLKKNSLEVVVKRLEELLKTKVIFVNETRGIKLEKAVNSLNNGEIILVQNTRYEDLPLEKESKNDKELGKYWASLGDVFINDAFGTSHRAHASNVGIASNLPNGLGFLTLKEVNMIGKAINNPRRPFTVILGGSKVSDKIGVIENLVKIADYILIGGAMAFTFLKAEGIDIGSSLLDTDNIDFCKNILKKYRNKIILPLDVVCANSIEDNNAILNDVNDIKNMGLDIGPKTIELFKHYINESKTIVWNGPMGVFENKSFQNGTKEICEALANINAITIIGGGDSAAAAIMFGYEHAFTHISTGGGASLEMLEGKILPGIDVINEKVS